MFPVHGEVFSCRVAAERENIARLSTPATCVVGSVAGSCGISRRISGCALSTLSGGQVQKEIISERSDSLADDLVVSGSHDECISIFVPTGPATMKGHTNEISPRNSGRLESGARGP